jgi:hypothetical protein
MSTSFYFFVNIAPRPAGASKNAYPCQRLNDRRGAKPTVVAALRVKNRLHLTDGMLIMYADIVNNKEITWAHAGLPGMRILPARGQPLRAHPRALAAPAEPSRFA